MIELLLAGGGGFYPKSGPGSKVISDGDIELGYFGVVSSAEVFKSTELIFKTGLSATSLLIENVDWLKFAYKGKFLFIAKHPIKNGISWNHLYEKGLVYGEEGFGLSRSSGTSQLTIVDKGEYVFRVRLIKGASSDPYLYTGTTLSPSETHGSEWNDLLYRVSSRTAGPYTNLPKWDRFSDSELGVNYYSAVQESHEPNSSMLRGGSTVEYSTYSGKGSGYTWRPVLEIIDPSVELITPFGFKIGKEFIFDIGNISFEIENDTQENSHPLSPIGLLYLAEFLIEPTLSKVEIKNGLIPLSAVAIPIEDTAGALAPLQDLEAYNDLITQVGGFGIETEDDTILEVGGVTASVIDKNLIKIDVLSARWDAVEKPWLLNGKSVEAMIQVGQPTGMAKEYVEEVERFGYATDIVAKVGGLEAKLDMGLPIFNVGKLSYSLEEPLLRTYPAYSNSDFIVEATIDRVVVNEGMLNLGGFTISIIEV